MCPLDGKVPFLSHIRIAQARQLANFLHHEDILLVDVFSQVQQRYSSDRVLLIADQFEELYTLCDDDVMYEPGNLPLLEFALTLLWERRTNDKLTHAAYEDIGKVAGALARHAEEKYKELKPDEKKRARRILIQLVRPGEGTEDTRRVATINDLGERNWSLVKIEMQELAQTMAQIKTIT